MIADKFKNDLLNRLASDGGYLGLSTVDGEVTAGDYSRVPITFNEPSNGLIENDKEIRFTVALSDWGTVTSIDLYDVESDGEPLISQPINEKSVTENEQIYIHVGSYEIEVVECD